MTSSSKLTSGIILLITGWALFLVGILISFSVVGACLGIPMALIGLPLWIWGAVWAWQGKVRRAEEAIATGVRQGIQQATGTQATSPRVLSTVAPPAPPPVSPPQDRK